MKRRNLKLSCWGMQYVVNTSLLCFFWIVNNEERKAHLFGLGFGLANWQSCYLVAT